MGKIIGGALISVIGIISGLCFGLILLRLPILAFPYPLEVKILEAVKITIGLAMCYDTVMRCERFLNRIGYIKCLRNQIEYYKGKN